MRSPKSSEYNTRPRLILGKLPRDYDITHLISTFIVGFMAGGFAILAALAWKVVHNG